MLRLPDTPLWALARLKLRQAWPARTLRRAMLALAGVMALQAGATCLFYTGVFHPWGPHWLRPAIRLGPWLGLVSRSWVPLYSLVVGVPFPVARWASWIGPSLVDTVLTFIMPAYAAYAVAPDRNSRRVDDYRMAGIAPRQVLLASALGSVGSFGALVVVVAGVSLIGTGLLTAGPVRDAGRLYLALWVLAFPFRAGVLVCVSALCRRASTAVAACYGAQLLVLSPVRNIATWAVLPRIRPPGGSDAQLLMVTAALSGGVSLVVLAALLPLALRALRSTQGHGRPGEMGQG